MAEAISEIPVGSIKISSITVKAEEANKNINLLPIVLQMDVFESILDPFMTMDLVIADSLSLQSIMPILGEEYIEVAFEVPHTAFKKKIEHKFRIESIKVVEPTERVRNVTYILHCVSMEAIQNWATRVRKSYADMKVSEMAEKLFNSYLKVGGKIEVSPSLGNRTIVIPNMHPTEALNFLAREAQSERYEPSNYVFFESADGFFFKTIEEMIVMEGTDGQPKPDRIKDKYYLGIKNMQHQNDGIGNNGKPEDYKKITDIVIPEFFDWKMMILKGGLGNKLFYINPNTSLFEKTNYDYVRDFGKFARTSKKTPGKIIYSSGDLSKFATSGDGHHRFIITNKGEQGVNEDTKYKFLQYKVASMAMLDNLVAHVTIPGDTERRAGEIIWLELPEFGATDDVKGKTHKFISGEWFVTSVRHMYKVGETYKCIMECVKNAYEVNPDEFVAKDADQKPTPKEAENLGQSAIPAVDYNARRDQ